MLRWSVAALMAFLLSELLSGHPLGFLRAYFIRDRVLEPIWGAGIIVALLAGVWAARWMRRWVPRILRPALVLAAGLLSGVLAMTVVADGWRRVAIGRFEPDRVVDQSFLTSLRHAPREFQLYLHAVLLKDCRAYGWSYREMAPYPLPRAVQDNTVPPDWRHRCGGANASGKRPLPRPAGAPGGAQPGKAR